MEKNNSQIGRSKRCIAAGLRSALGTGTWLRLAIVGACLLAAPHSVAGSLEVAGNVLHVRTGTLEASFEGASLVSLKNVLTGESYLRSPRDLWLDLEMSSPGQPLRAASWRESVDSQTGEISASTTYQDSFRTISVTVGIDSQGEDIFIRLQGRAQRAGVRFLSWGISGFDLDAGRLLIPGAAGAYLDRQSNPPYVQLEYPTLWECQAAVFEAPMGGVLLYARDPEPSFKRLRAGRLDGQLLLVLDTFASGNYALAREVPTVEWRLHGYRGEWREGARVYRDWIQSVRPVVPAEGNRAWVKDIRAVVTLTSLDPATLPLLAKKLDPSKTLLYLVDWRKDPYDFNYPDYSSAPLTMDFVTLARGMGFRIMLHVNMLGVAPTHPAYAAVQSYQMRFADGNQPLNWPWDRPAGMPAQFAFISPAAAAFRSLLIDSLRPAMESLRPDALHLDAGAVIINDGNGLIEGLTSIQGLIRLYRDLQEAFPDIVMGSESTNEISAPFTSLAQRWPSSIPGHAISAFMLGSHLVHYAFQDQPPPEDAEFIDYLKRYEVQGVLPTPVIGDHHDLGPSRPGNEAILDLLRIWQDYRFAPDWDSDWNGAGFQYRSADGETVATLKETGNIVRLGIGDFTVYQRVRDVQAFQTPLFISNWPVYDSTSLSGMDPERQYWLTTVPSRPIEATHLTDLPSSVKLGANSLVSDGYALFEISRAGQSTFDFLGGFLVAKLGTRYGDQDYPLINGSQALIGTMTVEDKFEPNLMLLFPPWKTSGGAAWVEYLVPVPNSPKVSLNWQVALADAAVSQSDGAIVAVKLEDRVAWQKTLQEGGWNEVSLDLTPYAGRTIRIRLYVHPGPRYDPSFDWIVWRKLTVSDDSTTEIRAGLQVSAGTESVVAAEPSRIEPSGDSGHYDVRIQVPGQLVLFLKPPQTSTLGQSLLDLAFQVLRAGHGDLPFAVPFRQSGTIESASSGGDKKDLAVLAYPPPRGRTILSWSLQTPQQASRFEFSVGLADDSILVSYPAVELSVLVNGQRVWRKRVAGSGWTRDAVDLSAWQGQSVILELVTDLLKRGYPERVYWADLAIN